MIRKYRKKPVVIEAIQCTEESYRECVLFCGENFIKCRINGDIIIETLEGPHIASLGDYIIKGVKGEVYPCKSDIFDMTYEEVEKV